MTAKPSVKGVSAPPPHRCVVRLAKKHGSFFLPHDARTTWTRRRLRCLVLSPANLAYVRAIDLGSALLTFCILLLNIFWNGKWSFSSRFVQLGRLFGFSAELVALAFAIGGSRDCGTFVLGWECQGHATFFGQWCCFHSLRCFPWIGCAVFCRVSSWKHQRGDRAYWPVVWFRLASSW